MEVKGTHRDAKRKQGGIITMPFILANEACDKLAIVGFNANMLNYLTKQLHMPLTKAATTLTNYGGTSSLTPLIGAFISDAVAGRFWTITVASFIYVLGMACLTLSAILPHLRPPPCRVHDQPCEEANTAQLGVLYIALLLAAVGSGGIRPCVVNFGADQFDETDLNQKTNLSKYFNWYYFVMGAAVLVAVTVIVYIQDNIGWGLGLGIPTVLMLLSCVALVAGYPLYRKSEPAGSPFTRLLQVAVAAFNKRKLSVDNDDPRLLYENDELDAAIYTSGKLFHTSKMKFLDKAAIIGKDDDTKDPKLWRLSTVHRVEELKSMIRMWPIWGSGILLYTAYGQQNTFSLQQATTMDRHLTASSFQIPAGSMSLFTMVSMLSTIVFYDRVFVPVARRFTGLDRGITYFHRMGIGFAISTLAPLIAGFVEVKRKRVAAAHGLTDAAGSTIPISAFWLVPQYGLHGLAEAFIAIGQLEFFYDQTPESMRSTATALIWMSTSVGSYVSTLLVTLVHKYSSGAEGSNWLSDDNLNKGKLEYFYWLITLLQLFNFIYYVFCAKFYTFKPLQVRDVKISGGSGLEDGADLSSCV